jgi:hypothetical protein
VQPLTTQLLRINADYTAGSIKSYKHVDMAETYIVRVAQGKLRGGRVTTNTGTPYYSFQGIPYAKPPVGELRFKV